MKFIETSAKDATNVEEAFMTMTKEIIKIKSTKPEKETKQGLSLSDGTKIEKDKGGCCGKK